MKILQPSLEMDYIKKPLSTDEISQFFANFTTVQDAISDVKYLERPATDTLSKTEQLLFQSGLHDYLRCYKCTVSLDEDTLLYPQVFSKHYALVQPSIAVGGRRCFTFSVCQQQKTSYVFNNIKEKEIQSEVMQENTTFTQRSEQFLLNLKNGFINQWRILEYVNTYHPLSETVLNSFQRIYPNTIWTPGRFIEQFASKHRSINGCAHWYLDVCTLRFSVEQLKSLYAQILTPSQTEKNLRSWLSSISNDQSLDVEVCIVQDHNSIMGDAEYIIDEFFYYEGKTIKLKSSLYDSLLGILKAGNIHLEYVFFIKAFEDRQQLVADAPLNDSVSASSSRDDSRKRKAINSSSEGASSKRKVAKNVESQRRDTQQNQVCESDDQLDVMFDIQEFESPSDPDFCAPVSVLISE